MAERTSKIIVKTQTKKQNKKLSKSKRKKLWELYDKEIVVCDEGITTEKEAAKKDIQVIKRVPKGENPERFPEKGNDV